MKLKNQVKISFIIITIATNFNWRQNKTRPDTVCVPGSSILLSSIESKINLLAAKTIAVLVYNNLFNIETETQQYTILYNVYIF